MTLRVKIILIYFASLVLSVIVFILATWFLFSHGWWSGLSQEDMDNAASEASKAVSEKAADIKDIKQMLAEIKEEHVGMEFEFIPDDGGTFISTSDALKIDDYSGLIQALSENGRYSIKQWIAAKETKFSDTGGYIIVMVPDENYRAVSFYINYYNGYGIFGKMMILGFVIALAVSCGFAYFFTRKISKRFGMLSAGIQSFDMGNLDVGIEDIGKDEIGHLSSTFRNMAEHLRGQINLEKNHEEERKKLVSNISHDLRTPLTSIIGYSESLENEVFDSDEERRKYISIIKKKAEYMNRLLGELLELSRLEYKQYKADMKLTDISELSRQILIEYLPLLEKEGIELITDIPESSEAIYADSGMLSRAVRNLLDNAVKYGASGKRIEYMFLDECSSIDIKIRDFGPGIETGSKQDIFKRFYRGDSGRASDGSMGLGLAIADEIIKLHGGKLSVENAEGSGAVFIICLPKRQVSAHISDCSP